MARINKRLINSESATSGQVLAADGTGKTLWRSLLSAIGITYIDTTASSGSAGAAVVIGCDDGAALALGDKIAKINFTGSKDASHTLNAAAEINVSATENWTSTATGSRMSFRITPNTTLTPVEKLCIENNGKIGVGCIPDAALDVAYLGAKFQMGAWIGDTSYGVLQMNNDWFTSTSYNFMSSPADPTLYINRPTGKDIYFKEGNGTTSQMSVKSTSGNVGIGIDAPTQKLQVVGTIYSSSGGFKFPDGTVQTTAATGGGGGGSTTYTASASVDFGANDDLVQVTVSAAWITSTTKLFLTLESDPLDHDTEDVLLEELKVTYGNVVVGTSFDIFVHAPNETWGRYVVDIIGV
jgi:hypothetical protein